MNYYEASVPVVERCGDLGTELAGQGPVETGRAKTHKGNYA